MECPGLRPARICGRTECVPPRKPSFAPFPGLPPLGHASLDGPPAEGRALHARDDGITPTQMFPPFGHRPVANSSIIATWLGSPPALPPGRGDRAPPRRQPLASSLGPSPQGHLPPAHPPGGAGSARPQGWHGLDRGMCPVGPRLIVNPSGGNATPRLTSGPYLRTHRVRPSEKTTLPVISGFSPQGLLGIAWPFGGGAGSARPKRRHRPDRGMSLLHPWLLPYFLGGKDMPRHA